MTKASWSPSQDVVLI